MLNELSLASWRHQRCFFGDVHSKSTMRINSHQSFEFALACAQDFLNFAVTNRRKIFFLVVVKLFILHNWLLFTYNNSLLFRDLKNFYCALFSCLDWVFQNTYRLTCLQLFNFNFLVINANLYQRFTRTLILNKNFLFVFLLWYLLRFYHTLVRNRCLFLDLR